jgi:hypothetical protein
LKRLTFILLALPLVVVLVILSQMRWKFSKSTSPRPVPTERVTTNASVTVVSPIAAAPAGQSTPFLGEVILREYANTNLPPENDLTLMSRLMENSLLLLKSAANRPLSANEDWADLFRGRNPAHERFLSDGSVALNPQGQLVDRWGTPLFFHALGGGRYAIRSAGPDHTLWTDDDLQRNSDGTFHRGGELNPEPKLPGAKRP